MRERNFIVFFKPHINGATREMSYTVSTGGVTLLLAQNKKIHLQNGAFELTYLSITCNYNRGKFY